MTSNSPHQQRSVHWASRRISRHISAINFQVRHATASVKKKMMVGSQLETISDPSMTITRRAAEARKVLDDKLGLSQLGLGPSFSGSDPRGGPNSDIGPEFSDLLDALRNMGTPPSSPSSSPFPSSPPIIRVNDEGDFRSRNNININNINNVKDSSIKVDAELLADVLARLRSVHNVESLRGVWLLAKGVFYADNIDASSSFSSPSSHNEVLFKAKQVFLANFCVEMLHYLLQYLLQFSFKNDAYLRYWEERELEYPNWYWVETTPYFWCKYLLFKNHMLVTGPMMHPKRQMRLKLKTLRELRRMIAESIGRLTAQLNSFIKLDNLDKTPTIIEESILQCKVVLKLFSGISSYLDGSVEVVENPNITEEKENSEQRKKVILNNEWFTRTYNKLGECTTNFEEQFVALSARLKTAKIPNWYSTHWMHIGVGAIVCYFATKSVYESRHSIVQYSKDTYLAVIRFWHEHLELPLKNIWEVIRYDKSTLAVSDELSLKQDVESLGRMVAEFAKENNVNLNESDLHNLMESVKRGDLSHVMRAYEQNIKSPIRSVIFGDLIRLVLIQVQKQKVDLEKAMAALDQLLRANELNFQFLATIPAVLLIGVTTFQLRHLFTRKAPNKVLYASIHSDMRNLERMLNVNALSRNPASSGLPVGRIGDLSYEVFGLLLHITTRLHYHAGSLAGRNKAWFEEDLKEIESEKTNATQKLATIQRMYHTYTFLKNN